MHTISIKWLPSAEYWEWSVESPPETEAAPTLMDRGLMEEVN